MLAVIQYQRKARGDVEAQPDLAGLDPINVSKARLAQTKASQADIELRVSMGKYLPVDRVGKLMTHLTLVAKRHLYAMPARLASRIIKCKTPIEAQAMMRKEIDEAMSGISGTPYRDRVVEYARDGGKLPHDLDEEPADDADTEDAGKVGE